ncbi:uncharacterized protein LOC143565936 [Bidens hawaiensis]|uniref:uncharacterized protein LOC143565936 n=1 Tax=Bidens hawaiensis TaxID=980011 RepID=UPI00404AEAB9
MNAKKSRKDSYVVTGRFLVNNHYAYVLSDTGADLSFVSNQFEPLLGIKPSKLDNSYSIELPNGKLIETSEVVHECNILLEKHKFPIDILPVGLVSFDIVVGMDWLSKNGAEIVCSKNLVCLPTPTSECLAIHGDRSNTELKLSSITKTRKILRKRMSGFPRQCGRQKAKDRKIDDIPLVQEFPEVFTKDLPGLPPQLQVEFRIDLVQDAAPIARSSYRLAPSQGESWKPFLSLFLNYKP